MIIIKPFLFKDELDVLEIQLEELYDVVDYFVIVEGELSFQGRLREGYPFYQNNAIRYEKYKDKILYYKIDADAYPNNYPEVSSPERRDFSYAMMKEAVKNLGLPNDAVVLFGDCDEIPRREAVMAIRDGQIKVEHDTIIVLQMALYYFYFNYISATTKWNGFKALTLENFLAKEIYNQVRCLHDYKPLPTIKNCGWHYSYFGDLDFVINKLNTTCDGTQLRQDSRVANKENIQEAMKTGKDIYHRTDHHWEILPIEELDLPQGVAANQEKYKQYFNTQIR